MILSAAQLTPSGRPVLQPGEVEVGLLDKVDMELQPVGGLAGQQVEAYKNGYAILTNRRLIWVDAGPVRSGEAGTGTLAAGGSGGFRAAALPLAAVVASHKRVQYSLKGAKVRLALEVYTDRQRQPVPASGFHTHIDLLALRCRGPAPDAFKAQLEEQVRQAVAADAASAGIASSQLQAPGTGPDSGGGGSAASAVGAGATGGGPIGAHYSPLRAGLHARLSPPPSVGSPGGVMGGGAAVGAGPIGSSAAAAAALSPASSSQRPHPVLLQTMVEMGFPRNRSARSLLATSNLGVQEAVDYLLAFGDQPGMDDPLELSPTRAGKPPPPPVAATAWAAPPPSAAAATGLYPPVMPASGQLAAAASIAAAGAIARRSSSSSSVAAYPHVQQSAAAAVLSPYGAAMYGTSAGAGASGPASPAVMAPAPLHVSLQQQLGLRLYPHQYGSAPDLAGAAVAVRDPGVGLGEARDLDGVPARTIGVAGIVKREQQKTAESGRAVEQAFRDLSALMSSAAAMVTLAEKFRGVVGGDGSSSSGGGGAGPGAAAGSGGGEDPLLLDVETQQQLIALGISSPVTRETAGARFHIELSRQLADFLAAPLQRCGGLMSLPDVYCLFNRARGTELVSPDDLLQAARLFGRAGVAGLRLRPLSSGVLVVQGPQHSEEQVCAKIAELTRPPLPQQAAAAPAAAAAAGSCPPPPAPPQLGPGLASSDVARALGGISVAIAAEHLLTAEARGVVCRDDGPEGLRFYRNFFVQDWLNPATVVVPLPQGG